MGSVTNILDPKIAALLDAGDIEGACMLAAKLPKPVEYQRAMLAINDIVSRGMAAQRKDPPMESQFSLSENAARVTHFETDKRVSDDPAADATTIAVVAFELTLPSELLAGFYPTLRAALFHKSGAITHDLANVTQDAPDVRFPEVLYPIKIKKSWEGAEVVIHKGLGGKSDLVLSDASISTFNITPKNGSVFVLGFTARSKVESSAALGRLADMVKTDVTISLEPPDEADPEDDVPSSRMGDGNPAQQTFQ